MHEVEKFCLNSQRHNLEGFFGTGFNMVKELGDALVFSVGGSYYFWFWFWFWYCANRTTRSAPLLKADMPATAGVVWCCCAEVLLELSSAMA